MPWFTEQRAGKYRNLRPELGCSVFCPGHCRRRFLGPLPLRPALVQTGTAGPSCFHRLPKSGRQKNAMNMTIHHWNRQEKNRHLKKILRPMGPTCCLRVVCVALTTRCAIAPVWRQTVVWYGTPISDVINLGICRSSLRITDGCCYLFLWAPGQESRVNIILHFNNRAIKKFGSELLCYICFLSLILIKFSKNYAQQWCSPLK